MTQLPGGDRHAGRPVRCAAPPPADAPARPRKRPARREDPTHLPEREGQVGQVPGHEGGEDEVKGAVAERDPVRACPGESGRSPIMTE